MSTLPYRSSDDGDPIALGYAEDGPIDDGGFVIGYAEAQKARLRLSGTFGELDQIAAELKDWGEISLQRAVFDLMKRVQTRIDEVSR